jgi:hypothetical protein
MGTGYVSHLLRANELHVLHEFNGLDGMISWLSCVNSEVQPWGDPQPDGDKAYFVIARSPVSAIKSIIAENKHLLSLDWRREKIKERFSVDIFDESEEGKDEVALAVSSLYYWYRMCFSYNYKFIFRVDVPEDLDLLSNLVNKKIVLKDNIYKNSHPERYADHPYTSQNLNNLSKDWKIRFAELCNHLGYPKDVKFILDMV